MSAGEYYLKQMAKGSSKRRTHVQASAKSHDLIREWQTFLGIADWKINCEPISEMQVMDALKGDSIGHEFVGISIDFEKQEGIIHHTRPLSEDDIIHELLHVRFPSWSEQKVDYWTNLLERRQFVKIA